MFILHQCIWKLKWFYQYFLNNLIFENYQWFTICECRLKFIEPKKWFWKFEMNHSLTYESSWNRYWFHWFTPHSRMDHLRIWTWNQKYLFRNLNHDLNTLQLLSQHNFRDTTSDTIFCWNKNRDTNISNEGNKTFDKRNANPSARMMGRELKIKYLTMRNCSCTE